MRSLLALGSMLLAVSVATGCGDAATPRASSSSSSPQQAGVPTSLTCPSGEQVATAGGLLAEVPDGYDTQEAAVSAWLADTELAPVDSDIVVTEDGQSAWVLRDDGTAVARVGFVGRPGFTVHDYEACSG